MKKTVLFLFLLLIVPFAVSEIQEYSLDYAVSIDQVLVHEKIILTEKGQFNINLPRDAEQINIVVDGKEVELSDTVFGQEIKVEYFTEMFLERTNFLTEFIAPENIHG